MRSKRGIFGTALIFAIFHANVWPTPVPLFALGLALGYLAYRTQSLVAPIVLHGLFNGVTALALLYMFALPGEPNGKATTSARTLSAPKSTSSAVPGSWKPRRTYPSPITVPNETERTDDVTYPTLLPAWSSLLPCGTGLSAANRSPAKDRFTWPYVRMRAIVSWPI